jgi:serine kinase of HPr protein (carbohydrate metabolism regulator)
MTERATIQVHASCVELAGAGILLRGPSGSGKSDLALRLIDAGARLVADDRTDLTAEDGQLIATSPNTIAGKLEVRGIGIVSLPRVERTRVAMAVDLLSADEIDRLPSPRHCSYLGIELPLVAVAPFECSAPAKLRLAVRGAARGQPVGVP